MLTWLTITNIVKKAWTWLKHNWYAPAIVAYTIVLWVIFRKGDQAQKILEERVSSYKAQIDAINLAHEQEIAKRNEIVKKFTEIITQLEKEYEEKEKKLEESKKKEIKKMVEKYHDKPEDLTIESEK